MKLHRPVTDTFDKAWDRDYNQYKAHYSLDRGDGIEHDALYQPPTPEEIMLEQTVRESITRGLKHIADQMEEYR